jgi:hypothetical protein
MRLHFSASSFLIVTIAKKPTHEPYYKTKSRILMRLKNAEMLAISSVNTTKEVVQLAEKIQLNQIDPAALLNAKKYCETD